jgi:hypothetical protein
MNQRSRLAPASNCHVGANKPLWQRAMAAWITTYLRQPRRIPAAATIKRQMPMPDWWTLAENFNIDKAEVDRFLASLSWTNKPSEIRAEKQRALRLHVWTDAKRVRAELAELDEVKGPVPVSVRPRLAGVKAVVAIELGFSQLETMFEVVGFEIAYWLAETRDGVIKGPNDAWFDHTAHRWNPFE